MRKVMCTLMGLIVLLAAFGAPAKGLTWFNSEIDDYSPEMEEMAGSFAVKYKDLFTDGEIINYEKDGVRYYQSPNIYMTITSSRAENTYSSGATTSTDTYVADFYIKDITCLQTAFAEDTFGVGYRQTIEDLMLDHPNGVISINGDFCTFRSYGIVIRNGMLYRSSHSIFDACAIYWDGTMITYPADKWTTDMILNDPFGPYQVWNFGPSLIDDEGKAITSGYELTASGVLRQGPRTAIGYYEPGHYCFVVVDGRSEENDGFLLPQLARFMEGLGCTQAYNLDGGRSSVMWYDGEAISNQALIGNTERELSDVIFLAEID